jgi:hypothetical protein
MGRVNWEISWVLIAVANACVYCNAAHSFIGEKLAHIDLASIADARNGVSEDPKILAALENKYEDG